MAVQDARFVTNMLKRFKIIKIVYANNVKAALSKERLTEPVEVALDQEVPSPEQTTNRIGFKND